ncbi:MAG: TetR/AcrR family transcriptional regulator [Methylobacterium sp.]|nr:TetR/AcrR family transcriptional regulator [Roseomonas sp.]MCA3291798.1 TetR/AcrR family transcriptional regulator [Roseomonas sp.]MCA3652697.1 TetR/AcrR family transcriptional regulator [Methylobacterium sp.]
MTTRRRGRPRTFDRETTVRSAQRLIWEQGFEAMSLSRLEEAMGIRKSSLYSAFGSKLGLLDEAAQLYIADFAKQKDERFSTIRSSLGRLEALFELFATNFVASGRPPGCFLVSAAHSCSDDNAEAVKLLMIQRKSVAQMILAEIETGVRAGEFVPETPVAPLVDFLVSVVYGMSVMARDGKSLNALRQTTVFATSILLRYVAPKPGPILDLAESS